MIETKFKNSEVGLIPEDWKAVPLSAIGEVKMCKRILKEQTDITGDVPFYKIGTFGKEADAYIPRELYEQFKGMYPYPKKGAILISAAGTIGRTVVFDGEDAYFQDSNIVWIDHKEKDVVNPYLEHYFKIISWKSENGGTISRLYNDNLKSTFLCYPEDKIKSTIEYIRESKCLARYYGQIGYPDQLKILTEPPPIVYMSSNLKNIPLAAVVGSRKADSAILGQAKKITEKLIDEGYGIISGGAVGIDKIAHETALEKNAYTVAVIANGIDIVYPEINREMFETIKEKGLLITELMVGAKPQKSFFPTRNRLIAAMADVVVAFPASDSSGTYITLNWAKKLGKNFYVNKQ